MVDLAVVDLVFKSLNSFIFGTTCSLAPVTMLFLLDRVFRVNSILSLMFVYCG